MGTIHSRDFSRLGVMTGSILTSILLERHDFGACCSSASFQTHLDETLNNNHLLRCDIDDLKVSILVFSVFFNVPIKQNIGFSSVPCHIPQTFYRSFSSYTGILFHNMGNVDPLVFGLHSFSKTYIFSSRP